MNPSETILPSDSSTADSSDVAARPPSSVSRILRAKSGARKQALQTSSIGLPTASALRQEKIRSADGLNVVTIPRPFTVITPPVMLSRMFVYCPNERATTLKSFPRSPSSERFGGASPGSTGIRSPRASRARIGRMTEAARRSPTSRAVPPETATKRGRNPTRPSDSGCEWGPARRAATSAHVT